MLHLILITVIINALLDYLISNNYYLNNDFNRNFKDLKKRKEIQNLTLILFLLFSILSVILYITAALIFFYFEKFKILLLIMPFFFMNGLLIFFSKVYKNKSIKYNQLIKYFIIIIVISIYFEEKIDIIIFFFWVTYITEFFVNYFLFVQKFNLKINLNFIRDYRSLFFIKKFFKNLLVKQGKLITILLLLLFYITFPQFIN